MTTSSSQPSGVVSVASRRSKAMGSSMEGGCAANRSDLVGEIASPAGELAAVAPGPPRRIRRSRACRARRAAAFRCRAGCSRASSSAAASPSRNCGADGRGTRRRSRRSPRAAGCTSRRRAARRASRASPRRRGSRPASRVSSASAASSCRHLRSGLRRSVPKPVHGASTSTRSALPASRLMRVSRSWAITSGMDVRQPRARKPRLHVREALVDDVERIQPTLRAHQRAERERLAAGAGAEVDDEVVALRRDEVRDQLARLRPALRAGRRRATDASRAAAGRRCAARTARTASASTASPSAARAASASSRVALSTLTRRSNGAGTSSARASASRRSSP